MKKQILKSRLNLFCVCLCLLSVFALTFPKAGKTNGVSASANAYAYKSGQNWVWSTFKAEAYAGASAPAGSVGVYELEAKVTGNLDRDTGQVAFFDGTSRNIDNTKTYRAWGSGSNMQFSASSDSEIVSNVGDDDDDATAKYP